MPPMSTRRRLTATLFSGAALGTTGYIAAVTVSALAVEEITGSATFAGLPGAVGIAGTAVGTTVLTLGVAKRGRRPGLITGYGLATLGAATAVAAVISRSMWWLVAAMAVLGLGQASNQLARYTGAELYEPKRRASALSFIVWAGAIGSVLGPILLEPGGALATTRGYSELAGGYLIGFAFMSAAMLLYLVALRPDPASLSFDGPASTTRSPFGDAFTRPQVKVGLAALLSGQVVMTLIMVATPLHIRRGGSDLAVVGLVMSGHTLGMFAFSPLTGKLVDRLGRYRTVAAGMAVLAVSGILAAVAPMGSTPFLLVALFLLGMGWNLCFVAGSTLLTVGFSPDLRARLQGRVDSVTWLSGAAAALASGIVFQLTDYRLLALTGSALLLIPTAVITRNRAALQMATAT